MPGFSSESDAELARSLANSAPSQAECFEVNVEAKDPLKLRDMRLRGDRIEECVANIEQDAVKYRHTA